MSSTIAAWIAHLTFWVLLPYGWFWQELELKGIVVFLGLGLAGWFGLPYLHANAGAMFFSWVAALDIALVFIIFKGDVRIT